MTYWMSNQVKMNIFKGLWFCKYWKLAWIIFIMLLPPVIPEETIYRVDPLGKYRSLIYSTCLLCPCNRQTECSYGPAWLPRLHTKACPYQGVVIHFKFLNCHATQFSIIYGGLFSRRQALTVCSFGPNGSIRLGEWQCLSFKGWLGQIIWLVEHQ